MERNMPKIEMHFPAQWRAEILAARPLILPGRHFVYPQAVEEVERGALEVMVFPLCPTAGEHSAEWRAENQEKLSQGAEPSRGAEPFLATCALGFRDPAAPTGVWACPRPEELCMVAGGYAYVVNSSAPEQFQMVEMRPVLEVRAAVEVGLLLFVGHRTVMAWGVEGLRWETEPLTDEGLTITSVEDGLLRGLGWEMHSDRERPFVVELGTGHCLQGWRVSGAAG